MIRKIVERLEQDNHWLGSIFQRSVLYKVFYDSDHLLEERKAFLENKIFKGLNLAAYQTCDVKGLKQCQGCLIDALKSVWSKKECMWMEKNLS